MELSYLVAVRVMELSYLVAVRVIKYSFTFIDV